MKSTRITFTMGLAALALCSVLSGQENRGTIVGRIVDPSGASVAGATVQVHNAETGLTAATESNSEGLYFSPSLPSGDYSVTVTMSGFKISTGVVSLSIQAQSRLDFTLELGDVSESVQVHAEASPLVTDTAAIGSLVDRKNALELPLAGRNLMNLTLLGPGVTNSQNGIGRAVSAYTAGGVTLSANGMRPSSNQYSVDGANVNSGFYNVPSFVPVVDAVEEFRVQTSSYSAEYGGYGGAHVNYSLKSGTNQLHGTLWEFLRNDKLDARNAYAGSRPPFRHNQFGGLLSGPIVKDRVFFMGSYEGLRQRRQSIGQGTVPTDAQRQGDLTFNTAGQAERAFLDPLTGTPFPGNRIPTSRLAPTTLSVLRYYPAPNQAGGVNFRSQTSVPTDTDSYLAKFDLQLSNANRLAARYALLESDLPGGTIALFGDFGTRNPLRSQNASILDTHILNATTILDFRLSWNRMLLEELGPRSNGDFDPRQELLMSIPSVVGPGALENGFPRFNVTGFSPVGDSTVVPLKEPDENYQLVTGLSMLRGKHALKVGLDYRRARSTRIHGRNTNGTLNFVPTNPAGTGVAFADFLLGLPQSSSIVDRSVVVDMRQQRFHLYLADNWNVHRKLTLELGLRYELNLPANEHYGRIPVFDFTAPGQFRTLEAGERLFDGDYNNFAPRVGVAFRPDSATVIRGSYGIFYSEPKRHGLNVRGINPPFVVSQQFFASRELPLDSSNAFPLGLASAGGVPAPTTYQTNGRTPYLQSWSWNVQRTLPAGLVAEVGYVGNHGVKFGRQIDLNVPLTPGPGAIQARRPLVGFGPARHFQYDSTSAYHGLQTRLQKRFDSGVSFQAAYTFSKALDLSGDELSGTIIDPRNLSLDRSLADTHIQHRFVLSYVWELPFGVGRRYLDGGGWLDWVAGGWQLSGITTLQSGLPFTVTAPGDAANVGLPTRPNRLCDGALSSPSEDRWFDTSCFVTPERYTFGNSGRNILIGPSSRDWDAGIGKQFRFRESHFVQLRVEMFNAPNVVNRGLPGTSLDTPAFGRITGAAGARSIQLGLKYGF